MLEKQIEMLKGDLELGFQTAIKTNKNRKSPWPDGYTGRC